MEAVFFNWQVVNFQAVEALYMYVYKGCPRKL